jgi:hypothetical protein
MKSVVLDTDVVSFLFKRDTRSELYLPIAVLNGTGLVPGLLKAEALRGRDRSFQIEVSHFHCCSLSKSRQLEGKLLSFGEQGRCAERVIEPGDQIAIGKEV